MIHTPALKKCLKRFSQAILVCCIFGLLSRTSFAETTKPSDSNHQTTQQFDLVIYGATPGGIAFAVRAAREGLDVQLVTHSHHLGGMLSNGLSTMDTLYNGSRAPIYDELRESIYSYYREKYGATSQQFQATQPNHPKTRYEAHVVEKLIEDIVAAEMRITVIKGYYPNAVSQNDSRLNNITFQQMDGNKRFTSSASYFAELFVRGRLRCCGGCSLSGWT